MFNNLGLLPLASVPALAYHQNNLLHLRHLWLVLSDDYGHFHQTVDIPFLPTAPCMFSNILQMFVKLGNFLLVDLLALEHFGPTLRRLVSRFVVCHRHSQHMLGSIVEILLDVNDHCFK